jgi:FkbM family methyltransferase
MPSTKLSFGPIRQLDGLTILKSSITAAPGTFISVGVRSFPYLADHGFQGMVVLPGSFYVDLALSAHRERFGASAVTVRNAVFQSPIILSSEDTHLSVDVTDRGTFVEYVFFEQVAPGGGRQPRSAARLEIHAPMAGSGDALVDSSSVESFQAAARPVLDGTQFYKALGDNGNRYGPHFQLLNSIWRDRDRVLAQVVVPARDTACRPVLLDVATQLLSAFTVDRGQTFILHSIDRIDIHDLPYPERLWAYGTWRSGADGQSTESAGDVRVVDAGGTAYLELHGARLTLLARDAAAPRPAPTLCVAATFTAEPLAEPLNFWADQLATPIEVAFSPYNQIFQQLLNPESAFHQNADGANVILLALEDWTGHRFPAMRLSDDRARQVFADRARYVLPNGLDIVHLHQYETDYLYKEIYEDQCYTRHGIRLRDDATVVDIGANIGLFSLFVRSRCARPRILAFEPAPVVFDLLKANCEAYGSAVGVFNLGVAATPGVSTFTFYENSSLFSGFHADPAEDGAAIRAVVRNILNRDPSLASDEIDRSVGDLVAGRLQARTSGCRVTSVSEIIREHDLATIDLLKIDAEKCELDILAGIGDEDWPRIQQIVIEVHDRTYERSGRLSVC